MSYYRIIHVFSDPCFLWATNGPLTFAACFLFLCGMESGKKSFPNFAECKPAEWLSRHKNFKYSNSDSNVHNLQYLEVKRWIVSNGLKQDGKRGLVRWYICLLRFHSAKYDLLPSKSISKISCQGKSGLSWGKNVSYRVEGYCVQRTHRKLPPKPLFQISAGQQ